MDQGKTSTLEQELRPGEEKTISLRDLGQNPPEVVTLFPIVVKDGKVITCAEKILQAECSA